MTSTQEITSEYAIKKTYCDLAIKINDKLRFLIEVKSIGLDLKTDHIRQVTDYGSNLGIDWVILTNGTNWKVFKIIFGKPVMNELIYQFDFLNLNPKKANDVELLYYVSKESLGKSVLEDFRIQMQALSKFFVGQILLTEPVLDAIKKTIKKICPEFKATPEDIKDVLMLDVIKREVIEDEKAEESKKKISRVIKSLSKKETKTIVMQPENIVKTVPPIEAN